MRVNRKQVNLIAIQANCSGFRPTAALFGLIGIPFMLTRALFKLPGALFSWLTKPQLFRSISRVTRNAIYNRLTAVQIFQWFIHWQMARYSGDISTHPVLDSVPTVTKISYCYRTIWKPYPLNILLISTDHHLRGVFVSGWLWPRRFYHRRQIWRTLRFFHGGVCHRLGCCFVCVFCFPVICRRQNNYGKELEHLSKYTAVLCMGIISVY